MKRQRFVLGAILITLGMILPGALFVGRELRLYGKSSGKEGEPDKNTPGQVARRL